MNYILKENVPNCHEDFIRGSFTTLEQAEMVMKELQQEQEEMKDDECWVTSDDEKSIYCCLKSDAEKLAGSRSNDCWHQDMIGISSVSYSIIACPLNKKGSYY